MSEKWVNRLSDDLDEAGVKEECPRCAQTEWNAQPMHLWVTVGDEPPTNLLGEVKDYFPLAAVVCTNCGFVAFHAGLNE